VNHVILPLTYKIFSSPFLSMYYQGKKKKSSSKLTFFQFQIPFPRMFIVVHQDCRKKLYEFETDKKSVANKNSGLCREKKNWL
jgi:hypothetical protein